MTTSSTYTIINSPIGEVVITALDTYVTGVYTPDHPYNINAKKFIYNNQPFTDAIIQLNEYFSGNSNKFNLPLKPIGTEFQKKIWRELQNIKYGEKKSYGEIAKILNHPTASRAVGMANSKNPISIIIPCHRVIGTNGKLTGYAGGIKVKEWLLNHEAKFFKNFSLFNLTS
jgi:methylated-DNA-[protein]-cysteine S-methyltransferase